MVFASITSTASTSLADTIQRISDQHTIHHRNDRPAHPHPPRRRPSDGTAPYGSVSRLVEYIDDLCATVGVGPLDRDPNIWTTLSPLEDGYCPAIPRVWVFTGRRHGVHSRFPVRLEAAHPHPRDILSVSNFSTNIMYMCHDWVRIEELVSMD